MKLIQLLLPVFDNEGGTIDENIFAEVEHELTTRFGGVTTYSRSPAKGRWQSGAETLSDEIIVVEVMTQRFDRAWWQAYRANLERLFRQYEIVIRVQEILTV